MVICEFLRMTTDYNRKLQKALRWFKADDIMREMQKRTSKDEDVYSCVCIKKSSCIDFKVHLHCLHFYGEIFLGRKVIRSFATCLSNTSLNAWIWCICFTPFSFHIWHLIPSPLSHFIFLYLRICVCKLFSHRNYCSLSPMCKQKSFKGKAILHKYITFTNPSIVHSAFSSDLFMDFNFSRILSCTHILKELLFNERKLPWKWIFSPPSPSLPPLSMHFYSSCKYEECENGETEEKDFPSYLPHSRGFYTIQYLIFA